MAKIFFVFLFMLCSYIDSTAEDKVKIGISLPLSGEGQIYGEDIKDFIVFANQDLAQSKYELVFEDDKCRPKEALSVAQKFTQFNKVSYMLGFACSGTMLTTAKAYSAAKIPVITSYASSPNIRKLGPYIFRTFPDDSITAKFLAEHIISNHKKIVIISEQTEYTQDLQKFLIDNLKNSKVEYVVEEYLPGTSDFRALLTRIKYKNPEAVFLNTQTDATFSLLAQQMFALKWTPKILGAYWPGLPAVLGKLGSKLDGTVFVDSPLLNELLNEKGVGAFERYKKQGGMIRGTEAVFASTYEAFRALDSAIQSGQNVLSYLNNNKWQGIFGEWEFDEDGEILGFGLKLKVIKNGRVDNL